MKEKESKDIFRKKWKVIKNSADNNKKNTLLPLSDKLGHVEKTQPFSIGDNWSEMVGDKIYFYKVEAIEDIAVSSEIYRCYKVIEEAEDGGKNYYWFAPKIGVVKWKIGKTKGILKKRIKQRVTEQDCSKVL